MEKTITCQFDFDITRMMDFGVGNLIGTSCMLKVTAYSVIYQDTEDFIVMFEEFEGFVKRLIVDKFHHAFVYKKNSSDSVELQLAKLLNDNGRKIMPLPSRVTYEKVAEYIFKTLNFYCVMEDKKFKIKSVTFGDKTRCCQINEDNEI